MHETPHLSSFLKELHSLMKPNSKLFIAEPSFHVSKEEFQNTLDATQELGFKEIERPKVFCSRSVLLGLK